MGKPSKQQKAGRVRRSGKSHRIAYDAQQHAFWGGCHGCGEQAAHGVRTDTPFGHVVLRSCEGCREPHHEPLASLAREGEHGYGACITCGLPGHEGTCRPDNRRAR